MIQLDLAKDQEQALCEQATARGLLPGAYAVELLSKQGAFGPVDPAVSAITQRRQEAAERIMQRRVRPGAPKLELPEGVSIREWLHQGHCF